MKFGVFFELSVPTPVSRRRGAAGVRERARAGRARGRARLRLCVGGRAPLPRGLLALLVARGVPDRGRGADLAHPGRSWGRRVRARDEPSGAGRRARRCPRHPLGRSARARHRAFVDVDRARRVRHRSRPHEEDVGRVRADHPADVDARPVLLRRPVVPRARAQRAAEADAGSSSAAVGHRDDARHRARCRRSWHRVPRRRGRDVRRAGAAHRRVPPAHRALRPRRIDRHERRHDAELLVLPRGHRRRRRARRAHGRRVLPPELAPALDAARPTPRARTSRSATRRHVR